MDLAFNSLQRLICQKIQQTKPKIKIQILTLAPTDWSHKKSHGCVWCFRTQCMQGSQIVFGKRYCSCARTKKGQVCLLILPSLWKHFTKMMNILD